MKSLPPSANGPPMVERVLPICPGLVPAIGYDAAAKIAHEAGLTGKTVREVAREQTDLSEEQLDELLNAEAMTEPTVAIAAGGACRSGESPERTLPLWQGVWGMCPQSHNISGTGWCDDSE